MTPILLPDFELTVHIGVGKTGTTAIQQTLAANQKTLSENKQTFLGLMCENAPIQEHSWQHPEGWHKFMSLDKNLAKTQLLNVLEKNIHELTANGFKSAIWSNESFYDKSEFMIAALQDLQSLGINIKTVAYVRRHDAWVSSAYYQWGIKHKTYPGPVKPFREWYKKRLINYKTGLSPWLEKSWLKLTIRNFDAVDDVVHDFLNYCGLNHISLNTIRGNETPNPIALALWTLYNSQSGQPILPAELEPLLKQNGILDKTLLGRNFSNLVPTQEELQQVRSEAAQDREWLNQQLNNFNQPKLLTSELENKNMQVNQHQIHAALLLMVKQQNDRISALERQLEIL